MLTCYVLVCCDDVDTFCPCLFGVLFLFGVLLINGQCHYLVFYIWAHIRAQAGLVLHICLYILICFLVFYEHDNHIWCYCSFCQTTIW